MAFWKLFSPVHGNFINMVGRRGGFFVTRCLIFVDGSAGARLGGKPRQDEFTPRGRAGIGLKNKLNWWSGNWLMARSLMDFRLSKVLVDPNRPCGLLILINLQAIFFLQKSLALIFLDFVWVGGGKRKKWYGETTSNLFFTLRDLWGVCLGFRSYPT